MMKCSTCNEVIEDESDVASGPDGKSHARCAKISTAHGQQIDLFTLFDEIGRLKKRVQDLERASDEHAQTLRHHARDIPFRIGGSH